MHCLSIPVTAEDLRLSSLDSCLWRRFFVDPCPLGGLWISSSGCSHPGNGWGFSWVDSYYTKQSSASSIFIVALNLGIQSE